MTTERLFHGGPLVSDWFGNATFWTRDIDLALQYADGGDVWSITIDWTTEVVADAARFSPRLLTADEIATIQQGDDE